MGVGQASLFTQVSWHFALGGLVRERARQSKNESQPGNGADDREDEKERPSKGVGDDS